MNSEEMQNEVRPTAGIGNSLQFHALNLFRKIVYFAGLLSLLNLISHAQNIIQLSKSIHVIVAWYHYIISATFIFFHIDISFYARNIIVLLICVVSVVNMSMLRDYDISLYRYALYHIRYIYYGYMSNIDNKYEQIQSDMNPIFLQIIHKINNFSIENRRFVSFIFILISILCGYATFLVLNTKYLGPIFLIYTIACAYSFISYLKAVKSNFSNIDKHRLESQIQIMMPYLLPNAFSFLISFLIGIYRKNIIIYIGLALSIFIIDKILEVVVDPYVNLLENIPNPPELPR